MKSSMSADCLSGIQAIIYHSASSTSDDQIVKGTLIEPGRATTICDHPAQGKLMPLFATDDAGFGGSNRVRRDATRPAYFNLEPLDAEGSILTEDTVLDTKLGPRAARELILSEPRTALITGAGGLLGRSMTARLPGSGWRVVALPRAELDITNEEDVRRAVGRVSPAVVINCAATGDVDRCETDADWAYAINEKGPRFLARACREFGADIVHISTDYVFDGSKQDFYTQEDEPRPLSVYGQAKLAGEFAVREEAERFFIVRTSWLFGAGGKNFGSRVIEYARKGAKLERGDRSDFDSNVRTRPRRSHRGNHRARRARTLSSHIDGADYVVRVCPAGA